MLLIALVTVGLPVNKLAAVFINSIYTAYLIENNH